MKQSNAGIKDVAARANVSPSTVSNVLSGTKPVSNELKQRVLIAVDELNYVPSKIAKGLQSGRTYNLAIVVPSIKSVFFPSLLDSIQNVAEAHGYNISVFSTRGSVTREKQCIQALQSQWFDGIFLSSSADLSQPDDQLYVESLTKLNKHGKHVIVCLEADISEKLDAVVVNEEKGIKLIVEYLAGQGRKNIAYISAPTQFAMGKLRKKGYFDGLQSAGLPYRSELVIEGDYSPASGYYCIESLLNEGQQFDAVLAGNDQMAIGAMRALLDRNKKIPDEIAVAGFNDNFPSTLVSPSLTTMRVPKNEMGENAFRLFLRRLNDPSAPKSLVRLSSELIIRSSTDPYAKCEWDLNW